MIDAMNLGSDEGKGGDKTDRGHGEDQGVPGGLKNQWRNQWEIPKIELGMNEIRLLHQRCQNDASAAILASPWR